MRVLHIQGFYVERGGKKKGFGINALQKKKTKTFLHSKPLVSKKKGEYSVRKKKLKYNLANREKRQKEVVDAEEHYERRSAQKKNIGI